MDLRLLGQRLHPWCGDCNSILHGPEVTMRVCIVKATQKLIEAQSLATEGTLLSNAITAGYNKDDIEEKIVTYSEFAVLLRTPDVIAREEAEAQRRQTLQILSLHGSRFLMQSKRQPQ